MKTTKIFKYSDLTEKNIKLKLYSKSADYCMIIANSNLLNIFHKKI